jgi:hypothetical protein
MDSGLTDPIEPEFSYTPQRHPYMPPGYLYFDDRINPQSSAWYVSNQQVVHHYQYTEKIVYRDRRRLPVGMAWAIFGLAAMISILAFIMMVVES